jgi:hypothetical protein
MATIRTQLNSERLVLIQDNVSRDRANQAALNHAVRTPGSSYHQSVFDSMWFQPARMHGCGRSVKQPGEAKTHLARPGCGPVGHRSTLSVLRIN